MKVPGAAFPEIEQLQRESVNCDLDAELAQVDFGRSNIYILLGAPRSDIGKGNLIARLARLPDGSSSILKFDPILNTNVNRNHPSPYDDFGTYRTFHPEIAMGWPNQILGGEVLMSFIAKYGGTEDHLSYCPQVAKYFVLRIHESWTRMGRPQNLFIELGGMCSDVELSAFALPGISILRNLHRPTSLMLLTEVDYDGDVVKTKPVQDALRRALCYGFEFNTVFIRKPASLEGSGKTDQLLERFISRKISNSLVYGGRVPTVILIPYYRTRDMDGYLEFLQEKKSMVLKVTGAA